MKDTGERHFLKTEFVDSADYYIHLLHIASYEFALKYVNNKKVLDYGCGTGYGTYMLSKSALSVVGVDVSGDSVSYAQEHFVSDNLTFKSIDEISIEKYDVIVSFQVIEHVSNDKAYINNLIKLLNPNGVLLLTTPNKQGRIFNYIQKPWNKYHLKEYSVKSMSNLLKRFFADFEILHISSVSDLVLPEILRRKKQRLISLPCTLFFYPNFLKFFLLETQSWLYKKLSAIIKKNNKQVVTSDFCKLSFLKYTFQDIIIAKEVEYSTDLFVICKNK
jgi:2-polyprenyl-3-methyl-5-hydroxy-6-metoxy-1,4-benzoquinol methylase